VVVVDVEVEEEYQFERRWYGSNPESLQGLAEWLIEQQVEEVVMESTAQYWKPLWSALERSITHAPDQTVERPRLLHCCINLAAPNHRGVLLGSERFSSTFAGRRS
jgi:hypothetical protein